MNAEPARPTIVSTPVSSSPGLSQRKTLALAMCCGLTVANIYYNQPLISIMTRSFGGDPWVGFVPTVTQIGYAVGIFTLIPLGDRLNRRKLIVGQTLLLSLALMAATLAPTPAIFLVASFLVGISTTIPQQIIPFAADLAAPERRGAVIGTVMSGLLCGILLARTVSGFVGEHAGWRAMYAIAVVVALGSAATLAAVLPNRAPATRLSYARLIGSVLVLVRDEPKLRLATMVQTLLFAGFSIFWTVLALRLEQPPFELGADVAGLFGLVGAAGALAAPLAGRIADRFGPRAGIGLGIAVTLACWAILGGFHSLAAMIVGVILLDAGVQGAMIGNQHIIFALRPEARNRVNTVFMGTLFCGASVGSAVAMVAWRAGGWTPVCLMGAATTILALALHGFGRPRARPPG